MSSLATFLLSELLNLSNEAKRKHPDIKDATERLLQSVRTLKDSGTPESFIQEFSKSEENMAPFVLACESKNPKLVSISITCLQKIISHQAMPEQFGAAVLKTLGEQKDAAMELQLKILQTVLPLVMNYKSFHEQTIADALGLCYKLQDTKQPIVNNTAAATFRQLFLYIFEKAGLVDKDVDSTLSVKDAVIFFGDVCSLTHGEPPALLKLKDMTKSFGFELIESVISQHYKLFKEQPELMNLLKTRVCPLLIKCFSEKLEYAFTVRLMRVSKAVIKYFHDVLTMESEILLSIFGKIVEAEAALYWHKILSLESLRSILSDGALQRSVYKHLDARHSTKVFQETTHFIAQMLFEEKKGLMGQSAPAGTAGETKDGAIDYALVWTESSIRVPCIEQLEKSDMPQVPETYHLYLGTQCILYISDHQYSFISPSLQRHSYSEPTNDLNSIPSKNQDSYDNHHDDIMLAIEMVKSTGSSVLGGFFLLLISSIDDEATSLVLKSFQNYTVITGLLGLVPYRDAFITTLCRLSVPNGANISADLVAATKDVCQFNLGTLITNSSPKSTTPSLVLNEKNVVNLKALVSTCDELQDVLENKAWYFILDTFQMADSLVSTGKVGKRDNATESKETSGNRPRAGTVGFSSSPVAGNAENQYLSMASHIKNVFEKTKTMKVKSLSEFTRALCQLSQECAIGASVNQANSTTNTKDSMKVAEEKSFAIAKLLEVALANISRLVNSVVAANLSASSDKLADVEIWDIIIRQLIEISHTPATTVSIRAHACSAFGDILTAAIQVADLKNPTVERRIVDPIKELILIESLASVNVADGSEDKERIVRYAWLFEVQKYALETLNRILQAGGQNLSRGWTAIFEIIEAVVVSTRQKKLKTSDNTQSEINLLDTTASSISTPVSASSSGKNVALIRLAFPSLQLICSDFLQLLNPMVLSKCIEAVSLFGSQNEDLNISLTAIGLLWSISDFVLGKKLDIEKGKIEVKDLPEDSFRADESEFKPIGTQSDYYSSVRVSNQELFQGPMSSEALGALWMFILAHLSQLSSDLRPEVRNSASQSLFGSINLNGKKLSLQEWDEFIWSVLFPLLERIQTASEVVDSPEQKKITPGHHSRSTPTKQWDETKVLTLNGVSKCFIDYMHVMAELETKFEDAWVQSLNYISSSCIKGSPEVSLAATKAFRSLMQYPRAFTDGKEMSKCIQKRLDVLWWNGWECWTNTAFGIILRCDELTEKTKEWLIENQTSWTLMIHGPHTQEILQTLSTVYQDIHDVVGQRFTLDHYEILYFILRLFNLYHTNPSDDPSAKYRNLIQNDLEGPTTLQQTISDYLSKYVDLLRGINGGPELLLCQTAHYASLPFRKKKSPTRPAEEKCLSYEALCRKAGQLLEQFVVQNAMSSSIYYSGAFESAVDGFGAAMEVKYDYPHSSTENPPIWRYNIASFLNITKIALDSLSQMTSLVETDIIIRIYRRLLKVAETFFLPSSRPPQNWTEEEKGIDDAIDVKFLESFLKDYIWYFAKDNIDISITQSLMEILQRGTRLYTTPLQLEKESLSSQNSERPSKITFKDLWGDSLRPYCIGTEVISTGRESFAFQCLRAIFQLCSSNPKALDQKAHKRIVAVALPVVLDHCQAVMLRYIADRPLSGRMPMPRIRNEELKLILTNLRDMDLEPGIIGDLYTIPDGSSLIWTNFSSAHLFKLYPTLCDLLGVVTGGAWTLSLLSEASEGGSNEGALADLVRDCLERIGKDINACI